MKFSTQMNVNISSYTHYNIIQYTIEFISKPFGMEWTATEDGKNLWVSNVTPMSQSARSGVVPGSMLIALNGMDIQNIGAPDIHSRASKFGLPLRVTFCKPSSLQAPKSKQDFSVREDVVNACVAKLKQPQAMDYSPEQKASVCKQSGANEAETASAIFLASYIVEHQQKSQQPVYEQQPQYGQQYGQQQQSIINYDQPPYGQQYGQQPQPLNDQQMYHMNNNNNVGQQPMYPTPNVGHQQAYATRNDVIPEPEQPPNGLLFIFVFLVFIDLLFFLKYR